MDLVKFGWLFNTQQCFIIIFWNLFILSVLLLKGQSSMILIRFFDLGLGLGPYMNRFWFCNFLKKVSGILDQ
jgi:hypothetical protein